MPSVSNFTAALQFSTDGVSDANAGSIPDIVLSWDPPLENGALYPDFNKYELKYDKPDGSFSIIEIGKDSIYYEIKNVPEGLHNFSIQAVSDTGPTSIRKTSDIVVSRETFVPGVYSQSSLLRGGTFNKPIAFSNGNLNISSSYTFVAPSGAQKVNP